MEEWSKIGVSEGRQQWFGGRKQKVIYAIFESRSNSWHFASIWSETS